MSRSRRNVLALLVPGLLLAACALDSGAGGKDDPLRLVDAGADARADVTPPPDGAPEGGLPVCPVDQDVRSDGLRCSQLGDACVNTCGLRCTCRVSPNNPIRTLIWDCELPRDGERCDAAYLNRVCGYPDRRRSHVDHYDAGSSSCSGGNCPMHGIALGCSCIAPEGEPFFYCGGIAWNGRLCDDEPVTGSGQPCRLPAGLPCDGAEGGVFVCHRYPDGIKRWQDGEDVDWSVY